MIEIIKYGKQFATCQKCGAVLKFDQSDIKTMFTARNEYEEYIVCPVCEYRIGKAYWKKDVVTRSS